MTLFACFIATLSLINVRAGPHVLCEQSHGVLHKNSSPYIWHLRAKSIMELY